MDYGEVIERNCGEKNEVSRDFSNTCYCGLLSGIHVRYEVREQMREQVRWPMRLLIR